MIDRAEMIISTIGSKFWYTNDGKLHRVSGPAIEYANGSKQWGISMANSYTGNNIKNRLKMNLEYAILRQ